MMETCMLLAGVRGPWALVTPVKAIMVGEVVKTKEPNYQKMVNNNLYLDEV